MTITLTIPDDVYPRVVAAFARTYQYRESLSRGVLEPITNPESREEFLQRLVGEFIENVTKATEVEVAIQSVKELTIAKNETEISFSSVQSVK